VTDWLWGNEFTALLAAWHEHALSRERRARLAGEAVSGYIFPRVSRAGSALGSKKRVIIMTAAHEHGEFPPVPFTEKDQAELRVEDVKSAKYIALLCSGIFTTGVVLYLSVLLWVWSIPPIYSVR
jgi:hypothetical protein